MSWQLILSAIFIGLVIAAISLYVYYKFKKTKIDNPLPEEIVKEFTEAERRFKKHQMEDKQVDGHIILKEMYDERTERRLNDGRKNSINGGADTSPITGEPTIKSGEPITNISSPVTGRSEVENSNAELPITNKPVAENVPKPTGTNSEAVARGIPTTSGTGVGNLFTRLRRN